MTTTTAKKNAKAEAIEMLRARSAELLKMEDREGRTRSGWWVDGIWLAPANDPAYALRIMDGGA